MDADLDTLATALYVTTDDLLTVTTDDLLTAHPERVPVRPKVGIKPKISDAELITLSVVQALLGFTSEEQFLRYARKSLRDMFPYLPQQSGYNSGCASSATPWRGWSARWRTDHDSHR